MTVRHHFDNLILKVPERLWHQIVGKLWRTLEIFESFVRYLFPRIPGSHGSSQVALVVKSQPARWKRWKRWGLDPWARKIPWRRAWQPIPVFLPGESHGQRSLAGYCSHCCKDLDTTEATQHVRRHWFTWDLLLFFSFWKIIVSWHEVRVSGANTEESQKSWKCFLKFTF